MVIIHSIAETIPPGPNIVQSQIDTNLVSSFPKNMNPEQPNFFPTLVISKSSVTIETPISHSQLSEIYFGPDGEVLPLGLIAIEEIPQPDTHLSQTHFGGDLYLYQSFPQSFPSSFVDPIAIQFPIIF